MNRLLKYGNIELQICDEYELTKSSQEIVYSDFKCDFTGYTKEDLPDKYQEVQIIEKNIFGYYDIKLFGYINTFDLGEMREKDVDTFININLLSPMKLTTLRTTTAIGTYNLIDLIQNYILIGLINDGFNIEYINIPNKTVTVNYLVETIETCMNDLSNKYNFWWYIDENKKIYIKDINTLLKQEPSQIYDETHMIPGLQYLKPITISDNYANVINFKNVKVYENSIAIPDSDYYINPLITNQINSIKINEQIDFNYPVDIKKENIIKAGKINNDFGESYYGLYIEGQFSDNSSFNEYILVDIASEEYMISNNIGFDGKAGDENKRFLLIRDSFFKNLIVGIKYNKDDKNISSIDRITSMTALVDSVVKLYNDAEIYNKKNVINKTGIVETTLDMNQSWKTLPELKEIGKSQAEKNLLDINGEIELCTDQNIISIGDVLLINKMIINSKYIVTQIKEIYSSGENQYYITAKNSNIIGNYIDIFKGENEQENEETEYKLNILHYNSDNIEEIHEVIR